MIDPRPILPERMRKITGSFAFIEHRFLHVGFWATLNSHELLFYLFLVMVSDRYGMSYYSYDKICALLRITVDEYIMVRNSLIDKDLIAFDGSLFQVLSLPETPVISKTDILKTSKQMQQHDPATVHQIIKDSFGDSYESNDNHSRD